MLVNYGDKDGQTILFVLNFQPFLSLNHRCFLFLSVAWFCLHVLVSVQQPPM